MTLNNSQARLFSFVQRIETLLEERKGINEGISDIKTEAKSAGFDNKVIMQMIRERAMSQAEREEWQSLCELYRATLGMLDGTPMSDNARRHMSRDEKDDREAGVDDMFDPTPEPEPAASPAEARGQGAEAFRSGKRVTENPFPAGDPARASWDEGWCSEAGSDGMDIPPEWRRSPKKAEKGDEA
ncbi:DUF2312 domain-containing protein [Gluconobacter albidus]|uniref:GapR-like DNA-binding domain-containing protein n=1 Tax=Gluconobacter albidus TaxID=318683 RepID=A0AAW3QZ66_9PROT|nr:DUF2312 domain-containing protein [Gluconobacter albidus]KXV41808.1 hypothetical protein AD941_02555 [Gluconobacter albidus]GBQ90055.1 hypothetical protein AA3250_1960 [Gluconobacter albidus NBRC 3250]GLQ69171.1 hypothetical protein GCM10007866_16220 [Gluconobacter albidus]